MKREAQQILICQKESMLGGHFCHCFPLPPPSLLSLCLRSASPSCTVHKWNLRHKTGTISPLYLSSQPWRHTAMRDYFNCGGQKGKCELIDCADKKKDIFLLGHVKPFPNCSVVLVTTGKHPQIHQTNLLWGIFYPFKGVLHVDWVARDYRWALFRGPRRAVSMGSRLCSSIPVGRDHKAEKGRDHSGNLFFDLISQKSTAQPKRDKVHLLYVYLHI